MRKRYSYFWSTNEENVFILLMNKWGKGSHALDEQMRKRYSCSWWKFQKLVQVLLELRHQRLYIKPARGQRSQNYLALYKNTNTKTSARSRSIIKQWHYFLLCWCCCGDSDALNLFPEHLFCKRNSMWDFKITSGSSVLLARILNGGPCENLIMIL